MHTFSEIHQHIIEIIQADQSRKLSAKFIRCLSSKNIYCTRNQACAPSRPNLSGSPRKRSARTIIIKPKPSAYTPMTQIIASAPAAGLTISTTPK